MEHDAVNHPKHYTSHPSGIECIKITEHMGFNLGNAIKYIWRADLKNDAIEDMRKAIFYIEREIQKREKQEQKTAAQLNQVAELIGTNDKNVVISVAIKTLVDAGASVSEAFDMVFGDGAYSKFAGDIYDALQQAA